MNDKAIYELLLLGDYRDANEQSKERHYLKAAGLKEEKEYDKAIDEFIILENYKDSKEQIMDCKYSIMGKEQ